MQHQLQGAEDARFKESKFEADHGKVLRLCENKIEAELKIVKKPARTQCQCRYERDKAEEEEAADVR